MPLELAAQAPLPLWAFGLIALVALGAVGWGARVGLQSLKQAHLLKGAVPYGALSARSGKGVAVSGRAELLQPSHDPLKAQCLWMRTRYQEYRRRHRHGSSSSRGGWHTTHTETESWDFTLHMLGGGAVRVQNEATEVHGTRSLQGEGSGGGGLFGLGFGSGGTRVLREYLPAGPCTVVGRLVSTSGGYAIVKDEEAGLLLTRNAASQQAWMEAAKGYASVFGGPLAWLVAVFWAYNAWYV